MGACLNRWNKQWLFRYIQRPLGLFNRGLFDRVFLTFFLNSTSSLSSSSSSSSSSVSTCCVGKDEREKLFFLFDLYFFSFFLFSVMKVMICCLFQYQQFTIQGFNICYTSYFATSWIDLNFFFLIFNLQHNIIGHGYPSAVRDFKLNFFSFHSLV